MYNNNKKSRKSPAGKPGKKAGVSLSISLGAHEVTALHPADRVWGGICHGSSGSGSGVIRTKELRAQWGGQP